jgi:hypothetical protein
MERSDWPNDLEVGDGSLKALTGCQLPASHVAKPDLVFCSLDIDRTVPCQRDGQQTRRLMTAVRTNAPCASRRARPGPPGLQPRCGETRAAARSGVGWTLVQPHSAVAVTRHRDSTSQREVWAETIGQDSTARAAGASTMRSTGEEQGTSGCRAGEQQGRVWL